MKPAYRLLRGSGNVLVRSMKSAAITAIIATATIAVIAAWWLQPDPYTHFIATRMAATKLPLTTSWPVTQQGVGPIRFEAQPSEIVRAVGKPSFVSTFAGESNDIHFSLRAGYSQFSFARGRLYRAYLQLEDFPRLTLANTAVTTLNRATFKDLGFEVVSEGRQDVKVRFSESVFVTIGFVADGSSPTGRPFYLSLDRKPAATR